MDVKDFLKCILSVQMKLDMHVKGLTLLLESQQINKEVVSGYCAIKSRDLKSGATSNLPPIYVNKFL